MIWRERDCVFFGSPVGLYAGVVKRVADVGWGSRSACTLFFILITLRNRKEFSESLATKAKFCQSQTSVSCHFGFAAKRVDSLHLCFSLSRLVIDRVTGVGGGAITCADTGCA